MKICILCLAALLLVSSLAPAATPAITWSTKSIDSPMFPGLQLRQTVSFSSSSRLSNVTLAVVPTLQPFVVVTPSVFSNIIPGQKYSATLMISVPENSPVQVVYSGTLQVKQGSAVVPATLKINVEVNVAAAQVPDPTSVVQDANGNLFPVNELIVDLNNSATRQDAADVASQVAGSIVGFVPSTNAYQVRLQTNSTGELDSAINLLVTDPRVEGVYRNFAVSFFDVLSDMTNLRICEVVNPTLVALGKDLLAPYDKVALQSTWNLLQMNQPVLHQVRVGIIDSGINRNHQEFTNPQVDTGTQTPSSPGDATGHGTAISGVIGANNAAVQTVNCMVNASAFQMTGIVGGAPGLSYSLRIQGVNFTNAFQASFSASIDNLANEGVDVINISWGTYLASPAYFAEQMGAHPQILFVMAAGNKGVDASSVVPANVKLPNTITVGATDGSDARAVFNPPFVPACFFGLFDDCSSNFGGVVDIAAPGTDIWAPATNCSANINSCYGLWHGTSFSAPMVTGAAAILKAIEGATPSKALSPQQIKNILISSADPIATDKPIGPRLNIFRAVQQALASTTVQLSFARTDFAAGTQPLHVAVGDFNNDGKLDIAVANDGASTVSVLLGNGDGTFQSHIDYATADGPSYIAIGDFNRDGKLDLAVTTGIGISILFGNGDGTFQGHVDYSLGGGFSVIVGDFNGDSKLDLAVPSFGNNLVSILLGNGDGTFQTHVDYPTGNGPWAGTVGDFNADGKLDLAITNFLSNSVSILLGNGDGSFQSQSSYPTSAFPNAVTARDLNRDGRLDLAVGGATSTNSVSVLLGFGNGTFGTQTAYTPGATVAGISSGDFDGDGKIDLVAADLNSAKVSVLRGNGDGTFQPSIDFSADGPRAVTVADFNGDGKPDLAVADIYTNAVSIFLNTSH